MQGACRVFSEGEAEGCAGGMQGVFRGGGNC